ncbi:hypothetical protein BDQ17DRAFT_270119 [Cyathus striatus]|nr:hypothetical protein BDQ17DRAFT_270119 [Cyathus striatus]
MTKEIPEEYHSPSMAIASHSQVHHDQSELHTRYQHHLNWYKIFHTFGKGKDKEWWEVILRFPRNVGPVESIPIEVQPFAHQCSPCFAPLLERPQLSMGPHAKPSSTSTPTPNLHHSLPTLAPKRPQKLGYPPRPRTPFRAIGAPNKQVPMCRRCDAVQRRLLE